MTPLVFARSPFVSLVEPANPVSSIGSREDSGGVPLRTLAVALVTDVVRDNGG